MTKTRKALLNSIIALVLCFSMLLGTTWAWFTDSVTSSNNIIQSGMLKAGMEYADDLSGDSWQDASTGSIFDYQHWEPGFTQIKYIKVNNKGNLAFKYLLNIAPNGAVTKLAEVIDVYCIDNPTQLDGRADLPAEKRVGSLMEVINGKTIATGALLPEGKTDENNTPAGAVTLALAMKMREDAGNEYQNMSLSANPEGQPTTFAVKLLATQNTYESDSFDDQYDEDSQWPGLNLPEGGVNVSTNVTVDGGKLTADATMTSGEVSATVPAGVAVNDGTTALTLSVSEKKNSESNVTTGTNEELMALDVHIEGISADNTTPILVNLGKVLPEGMNLGNVALYHVEGGETNVMEQVMSLSELDEHNEFYYDPATGHVTVAMATFSEITMVADTENAWKGEFDYSWYTNAVAPLDGEAVTEYIIANADQLWSFSQIVGGMAEGIEQDSFSGKTVKLISDINLGDKESENNTDLIFYPIGYWNNEGTYERKPLEERTTAVESGFYAFNGTFDGNGHTIANFYQNTWEMKGDHNWYDPIKEQYYRDGMGLFGKVYGGTVKNLTVNNFSSDGEIATTGVIAAYADGATFENIAIFNCNPRVYNIGNGGIVGCVGWYAKEADLKTTFTNITVDNSNKISALWGSYDVACGGIVGQYYPTSGQSSANYPVNGGVHFENCHISAQMDVYNDVCANYQYYAYRYTGMLIGSVRENETIDGHVYPKMDGITAKGCTVHFGDWNDYYYCEIIDNTTASYTHDYQMSRLTEIKAINGTTITYLDGTTGTVPASGRANYVIVDYTKGHGTENATCYHFKDGAVWTHDMGGIQTGIDENGDGQDDLKEDKQHIYLEFNNLVTGYGWGVTSKGLTDFEGVENLDIAEGDQEKSVEKFEGKVTGLTTDRVYTIDEIFAYIEDCGVKVVDNAVNVTITNLDENGNVEATFTRGEKWNKGTISFENTGNIAITIQDYYFCTATTINVTITGRTAEEKFDVVMNNGDFLHRVGNSGTVALDKLFKAKDGVSVGTVSVTVEAVDGTGASGTYTSNATWTNGTIKFSGTGVVKVTITDNDYCIPTELYLEVVDAVNATGAANATANNVVLLQNCGFSSLEVSGGYTLYGNGFTMTCGSDSVAVDRSYGFVKLTNGTLDNVRIVVPNFSHSILFDSNKTENGNPSNTDTSGRTRYYNIRSAVVMEGDSKIANSFISGGRAAVYVANGTAVVTNSLIYGGAAANIHVETVAAVTLNDVTLVQKPIKANVNDTTKTVMGLSIVTICNAAGDGGTIVLTGKLRQYAWAREAYKQYVPEDGQDLVATIMSKTSFIHNIIFEDGDKAEAVNMGVVFMPDGLNKANTNSLTDKRGDAEKASVPYETVSVSNAKVYTYTNANGTAAEVKTEPTYSSNQQLSVLPCVVFNDANENRTFSMSYDESAGWTATLNVDVDKGNYTFKFADLLAQKYGKNLSYTVTTVDGTSVNTATEIVLNDSGSNEYKLKITDDQIYDKDGKLTGKTAEHTYTFKLLSSKTSISGPVWKTKPTPSASVVKYIKKASLGSDWTLAIPVLKDAVITYWSRSAGGYVDLDLTTLTPTTNGKQANGANEWSVTLEGEYTLKITSTVFKTNYDGMPVVYEENGTKTLYYTVNNSNGCLGSGTTSRTITFTYTFTDANNNALEDNRVTWSVNKNDISGNITYDNFVKGGGSSGGSSGGDDGGTCLAEGTMITMADGSKRAVEDLRKGDRVMSFDHLTGTLTTNEVIIVVRTSSDHYYKNTFVFDDGTELATINEHGIFDLDLNKYVNIDHKNAADFIGHTFVSIDAKGMIGTKMLVDVISEQGSGYKYDIVTDQTLNYVAEDTLSVTHVLVDVINSFDFGENLTYDQKKMQADIEQYGLYTYEEWDEYCDISVFEQYNIPVMKVGISKGLYTKEYIIDLINTYVLDESVQIID